MKKLLLGDQAIALGALNAGISGVYAYPGTPSTEITEFIQGSPITKERGIHSRWCTNEKTAMEAALGASYVGKRALVCMKHVGMNVCADPFVNSAMSGVNGGVVVLVADDPSMHSSQNEQDSRFYAKFAMVPSLEPSNQQEAYDMMGYAFELSEQQGLPVMVRVTTRMAHSRAVVEIADAPRAENELSFPKTPGNYVLLPANATRRNKEVIAQQVTLENMACESQYNALTFPEAGKRYEKGVVTCGIAYNYLMETFPDGVPFPVLKITQYPIPKKLIKELADACDQILVLEEGQPIVEELIGGVLGSDKVKGRLTGDVNRTGELTPDTVKAAFGLACEKVYEKSQVVLPRPPALCQGCSHRDVYTALNDVIKEYPNAKVFSDIGCYTLGALPPFRTISSCIDMGASITMAKGAADSGLFPAIAVIGDSTFTHSGMTGLLDAINSKASITVVISDNLPTAMTGGQDSAGTGRIESICLGLGVEPEHLRVMLPIPKNHDELCNIIREEIEYKGVSVIVPRRECIQVMNRKLKQKRANKA